jgi:D-alanine-D-alanine ligase-like ATP-grasp enzyme
MFLKAHRLLGLECSGIDYMSPDITLPYYKNKGHIIEINSNPDTEIHMKAENRPNVFFQTLIQTFL